MREMSAGEVAGYMAYDLATSDGYAEQMQREAQLKASAALSAEDYTAQFKQLLGG